jgi:EmrB/QacA subfamily drug resistance transporter
VVLKQAAPGVLPPGVETLEKPEGAGAYRWWALSTTSLGALLAALNMSTLVIALPALVRALHASVLDVVWILLAYMLAQTATVLTMGRLGDMWGRKRLYTAGFALFTVMALASGFADSVWLLIVLRVVAGMGGALMIANSGAIVTDAFPRRELGLALGINGTVVAVGTAVGPVLGGWLTSLSWQWVFWFNVPLGIVGTIWSALVLRQTGGGHHQRIDWYGNAIFLVALAGLLIALSMGGIQGWTQPYVLVGGLLFVVGTPLFIWLETRVHEPLLDLSLFRNRLFAVANATGFVNGTARMGLLFLLVFYFQGPRGLDPVHAGLAVTPLALSMLVVSPLAGWVSDRIGSRTPSTLGLVITAVGLAGMAVAVNGNPPYLLLAVWMSVVGIGGGLFNPPNSSSIMASVPVRQRGVASGVRMLVAFTGSMISIAFVLAIVTSNLPPAVMLRIFSGVSSGLSTAAVSPFIHGTQAALIVLAALSLVTAPLSLMRGAEARRHSQRDSPAAA